MKRAIALISGGLDSAVTAAVAKSKGYEVYGITFSYGQRHGVEIESAKSVCEQIQVAEHKIFELDLTQIGGSSLTSDQTVPRMREDIEDEGIPNTYVPARNTIFLSIALGWAETIGSRDIFIGVSAVDYSGYPDCRPEYIEAFEKAANLGTRVADISGEEYRIHAPLVDLTKSQTIEMGLRLGVDFSKTWTCYDPGRTNEPCGECDSCRLRARGFGQLGIDDPALKRKSR